MAENSEISWTDHTFNPWSGCTKVSPACANCYAEVNYSVKMRGVKWGKYGNRVIAADSMWKQPLLWNRKAAAEGVRKRVFCASLADVFEGEDTCPSEAWLDIQQARGRLYQLIADTPHLDWLLLTKRPENVMRLLDPEVEWETAVLAPNVWIGTTVENQEEADKRIPELLKIPAKIRFLSMEPLLGPVVLRRGDVHRGFPAHITKEGHAVNPDLGIHWIIAGGESGHNARPMNPDWVRSIRDQCIMAGVPFHFKQWGNWFPGGEKTVEGTEWSIGHERAESHIHLWKDAESNISFNIGRKNAGRYLDGRTWDELPEVN